MKSLDKKSIAIIAATLVVGILLGWLFFGGSSSEKTEHDHATEVGTEQIYTCAMHPQIRQSEPGDCPICGMELIPVENGHDSADPMAITMSPTAMLLADVQSMVVGSGSAEKTIRLNGKVQEDERLKYTQASHIPGRVEKLLVNFTGDYVKAGQVLAYVYSPELVTAQEELFEAQKSKESQPALFKASREKLKNWKISDAQIDGILATKKAIENFPINANVSGYVTKLMLNLGDYVKQGQAIFEITDISKVWVMFDVYESEMQWVKIGSPISYTIESLPNETFKGVISYVDPVINPQTRVASARVEVTNSALRLKPEMFATGVVKNESFGSESALFVPKTAVMWTGKQSVVYVKSTNSQGVSFVMRQVMLGTSTGDSYLIESGLQAGEEIAVNGTFSIDAAAQLAGKPSMMSPEGGAAMTGHNHGGGSAAPAKSSSVKPKAENTGKEVKKELEPLFTAYFDFKNALANDDFKKASASGKTLNEALKKVDMTAFKGDAHMQWMDYSGQLEKLTMHLEHLKTLEELRARFIKISEILTAIAEDFDPLDAPVYVQKCTMANNNSGANWLSLEKQISNPYFGKAMPKCGETIDTIK